MPTEERDWYDTPLYYDIIFDTDTEKEADFLEVMHHRHGRGNKSGSVLEPACGSGRLIVEMARRGWKVAGFDSSTEMLDFARERLTADGLKAKLWEDWMQSFTVPRNQRFDLAHCFVTTFKHLLTERDALACLQRVAASLKPGGLFVLGLHLTDYDHSRVQVERWTGERDGVHVTCNIKSWPADRKKRTEAVRSRLTIQKSRRRHVQDTNWQFRTYNATQLRRLLGKVPEFELAACYDFLYDPESPRELDDSYADIVLVLRRTQTEASATVH